MEPKSVIDCAGCGNLIVPGDYASLVTGGHYRGTDAEGNVLYEEDGSAQARCRGCTETLTDALGMALRVIEATPKPGDEYPMDDEREFEHTGISGCCSGCDWLAGPGMELGSDSDC